MAFANVAKERARGMPPGKERESLLRRAQQNEVASNLTDLLSVPGHRRHGGP